MALVYLIFRCGHYLFGYCPGKEGKTRLSSDCPRCETGLDVSSLTLELHDRFVHTGKRWQRKYDRAAK